MKKILLWGTLAILALVLCSCGRNSAGGEKDVLTADSLPVEEMTPLPDEPVENEANEMADGSSDAPEEYGVPIQIGTIEDRPMPLVIGYATEKALSRYAAYDEFAAYEGEYADRLLFSSGIPVRNFKVLSLSFFESDENGDVVYSSEEQYVKDTLEPDCPLILQIGFPGDFNTYWFSFSDDKTGITRFFRITDTGYDGSPPAIKIQEVRLETLYSVRQD